MRTLQYHEAKQRGSMEFPLDYHYIDRNHARYEMPYHWHEETEILFVLSGTFSLSLDGESMELHPGEAAYFPAGSLHAGTPHDCVYECIVFDLRMLLSAPGLCREKMGEIEGRKVRLQRRYGSDDPLVRETLRPLFEILRRHEEGWELRTLGLLYVFFGGVYARGSFTRVEQPRDEDKKMLQLKTVFDLIESRYSQKLTLDDLASAVHLDRKYFCRFFKQATHMTPMQYLQYYRVEQALNEMQLTDKNVTEIALDAGFSAPEYFTRVFKKQKGIAPGQYLSQLRSGK